MSDDVGTVYEGMAKVFAALSHIPKGRSSGVAYEFRSIDQVMNHLHGPLADNGLFLAPRVLDDWQVNLIAGTNNRTQTQVLFRVEVAVWSADGSSVTLGPGLAQSHDYGDKSAYQAQQNAIKYLLLEAFCIPTSEQDMDAREAEPVVARPPVDVSELDDLIGVASAAGVHGDYDAMRRFAAASAEHRSRAVAALRGKVDEHQAATPTDEEAPF